MTNHREHFKWGSVSAWSGNIAADMGYGDRYECNVSAGLRKETLHFKMMDGNALETTKRALDLAFEMGERAAKKAVRDMLEIKEPRA